MSLQAILVYSANGLVESAKGVSWHRPHLRLILQLMVARMYTHIAASNLGR
jgi:hypothetical protein